MCHRPGRVAALQTAGRSGSEEVSSHHTTEPLRTDLEESPGVLAAAGGSGCVVSPDLSCDGLEVKEFSNGSH